MTYAVVGFSITGVVAALELASAGQQVKLLVYPWDNSRLGDLCIIGPTLANRYPVSGEEFEHFMERALKVAGVEIILSTYDTSLAVGYIQQAEPGGPVVFVDDYRGPFLADVSIFAPLGSQLELPEGIEGEALWDKGLAYAAWGSLCNLKRRPVVVLGCGYRALEQACLLAPWASSVAILCSGPEIALPRVLAHELRTAPNISVHLRVRVLGVRTGSSGKIEGVEVQESSSRQIIPAEAVFVAQDPVVSWNLWGDAERCSELIRNKRLYPAGIAAGIEYWDHEALYNDGIRVAQLALREHRDLK